jgi:hypothetical protein
MTRPAISSFQKHFYPAKLVLLEWLVKAINEQKKAELQDNILTLAMSCPVDQCNPEDCPLFKVRQMELTRRLRWFDTLSDDDLLYLNAYHFVCMKTKLESRKAGNCE